MGRDTDRIVVGLFKTRVILSPYRPLLNIFIYPYSRIFLSHPLHPMNTLNLHSRVQFSHVKYEKKGKGETAYTFLRTTFVSSWDVSNIGVSLRYQVGIGKT